MARLRLALATAASAKGAVLTFGVLGALAQAAGAVGVQLDLHEAPQPEVPARSDDIEGGHSVQEKSRLANKAAFKP